MRFEILKEEPLDGCYVASCLYENHQERIVFASETEGNGKAVSINPANMECKELLCGPGGCMGVIPLPDDNGGFMAIERFFPVFKSEDAEIAWYSKEGKGYRRKTVALLPFVHRIEILNVCGDYYLAASTLCRKKDFTDDWSTPGSVYAGRINFDKKYIEDFRPVYDGIYQNHGFTKIKGKETDTFLIAGQSGLLQFKPVIENGKLKWKTKTLLAFPVSDAAVADIDGDGELEYGVIAPFHGGTFAIYKEIRGDMECIYTLPGRHEFGHAIYGGRVEGTEVFMAGFRAGQMQLYLFYQNNNKEIKTAEIDALKGPANVTVIKGEKRDIICAANRQSNLLTVYGMIQ